MTNKLLFFIAFIFFGQIAIGQVDTRTKNQVRAKFEMAKEYYANKEYASTLKKLEEIEGLMNGAVIPTAQSLKVSTLLKLNRYSEAKNELTILENLELSSTIIKEVASYRQIINDFEESERLRIAKELKAEKQQLIKEQEEKLANEKRRVELQRERAAYENAMENYSFSSLKKFISDYPNSKFSANVKIELNNFDITKKSLNPIKYQSEESINDNYFEKIRFYPNLEFARIYLSNYDRNRISNEMTFTESILDDCRLIYEYLFN